MKKAYLQLLPLYHNLLVYPLLSILGKHQISCRFSIFKNCNAGVVAQTRSMPAVNIPVADYDIITIAIRLYIKISFYFSAIIKNYNVRKVILAADLLVASKSAINMPAITISATGVLIIYMSVVYMPIIGISVARTFLSNIFLAVFVFLITKIIT